MRRSGVVTRHQTCHSGPGRLWTLQFGPRQWGVQYHPEFDRDIMQGYIEARREVLTKEGLDPDAMMGRAVETPVLTTILGRFAAFAAKA